MSNSLFRILGPIMVGPSSSHTAGAVRIGLVARSATNGKAKKIKFYLHGSFRNTYKGHGTDKALTAGILGMKTDDERIINSLKIAKNKGLDIEFIKSDLGDVHPNTVKIEILNDAGEKTSVVASSIGGGEIRVYSINGLKINTSCNYNTLIITHKDTLDTFCKIVKLVKDSVLKLISLRLSKIDEIKNKYCITMLELDSDSKKLISFIKNLKNNNDILGTTVIEKINN